MAIVLVVMNGVFFSALRLRDRTADAVDDALPVQQATGDPAARFAVRDGRRAEFWPAISRSATSASRT